MSLVARPDAQERFGTAGTAARTWVARDPAHLRRAAWDSVVDGLRIAARGSDLEAVVELACSQGLVVTRAQARDCGVTDARTRSLVRTRRWSVPRYGVVCPLPPDPPDTPASRHERRIGPHGSAPHIVAAAAVLTFADTYVSHESAAVLCGLPVLHTVARPTLSSADARRATVRDDVLIRTVGRCPDDIAEWFGAPVTAVDRTIVDIARNSGVAAGLVVADAALCAELVSVDQLSAARERSRRRPGVTNADRVIELAAPAESPLESLTRLCLVDGGLPMPLPQQWIKTRRGWYRVDLLYPDERVVVEADGELKYRGDPEALIDEKRRHEALERAGYAVVRVSWADVRDEPYDVVARVRRALRSSRIRH